MRVTRIEIFGFKSFMDRIVLPLEGGITGVVGPNGCGKSNVVDALRWVLGETRASSLRGDVLEDIIFNGTESLRPLGLAEVTLSLRAVGSDLFSDLSSSFYDLEFFDEEKPAAAAAPVEPEVEAADDQADRPKERPVLTVIQGNLGNTPPADHQEVEEAEVAEGEQELAEDFPPLPMKEPAAVSETKKADPAPFLARFSWLKGVQEVQVTRRIYRSGESEFFINRTPCRLKDLKEFFRVVGLSARAHTIVAQGEVSRIISAKPEERRLILEDAAGVLGFRDKIAAAGRRLEETGINISRIDDILKEVTKQVGILKRQAARARSRKELKDRIAELDRALYADVSRELSEKRVAIDRQIEERRAAEQSLDAELRRVHAEEQHMRSEMMGSDVQADELRVRIDAIKEEINNRIRQRSELISRSNELKAFAVSRTQEIERLHERAATLNERCSIGLREIETLEVRERELVQQLDSIESDSQDDLRRATAELEGVREELKHKESAIHQARERRVRCESTLRTIEEQLIAASPGEQLKKTFGEGADDLLAAAGEHAAILADRIAVPPQYERAVQAVLAERAGYLLSDDPFSIGRQFRDRRDRSENAASGFGLGVLRAGAGDAPSQDRASGTFPRLLDCITVQSDAARVCAELLDGVYVAPTLEEALSYFEHARASGRTGSEKVVTLDGELISENCLSTFRVEGGLIPLKNRMSELSAEKIEVDETIGGLTEERAGLESRAQAAAEERDRVLTVVAERQTLARDLSNQLGSVRGRLQAERKQLDQGRHDVDRVSGQVADAARALDEYRNEEVLVLRRIEELVPQGEEQLKAELSRLIDEVSSADRLRSEGRVKLSELVRALEQSRGSLDAVRSEISQHELERQRIELEDGHIKERYIIDYGEEALVETLLLTAQNAPLDEETRRAHRDEIQSLRTRIAREGDVDPTSIERYEEENHRLEELTAQRHDLESAAQTIERTIERLSDTSRQLFMRTFEGVRRNFSALIPRLFGGGKGDLQLSDPTNPLDSGIDIIIKPPGKKLKSIELLSGGEKALSATALIFGMFLERPSPLCVLDEVDAPLDDANLVRFLSVVKEMSTRTQFVMITHNKHSMAQSDNLVGVTMQEPGSSRIITVSLQEAYAQVA